jgi:hypothetical protein
MPFTYFAHQAIVIPLKWARPRWFDGTALCVGSMAPDFVYGLEGTPLSFGSHTIPAQLFYTVPVTWLIVTLLRARVAEPLGAQLPGRVGVEMRALAHSRHPVAVTLTSAWLGGLSHVWLDGFTHASGWAVQRYAVLRRVLFSFAGQDIPTWTLLQYVGHTLGTMIGLLLVAALVRRRQISSWNGIAPAPERPDLHLRRDFQLLVLITVLVALVAAISGGSLPVALIRASLTLFAGLSLTAALDALFFRELCDALLRIVGQARK